MTLTAEQKKQAALALLLPIAGYLVYTNIISGGAVETPPNAPASTVRMPQKLETIDLAQDAAKAVAGGGPRALPSIARNSGGIRRSGASQEWTPRVGGRRPEDRADPAKTDPTLRLDMLARLQNVPPGAAGRSLFDFTTPPPPPLPKDVKFETKKGAKGGLGPEEVKPPEPPPGPTGPPPEPPPPAIPLKFYGFVHGQGGKRAFFRLGEEEIFMASEGQTIQARYKIVRIGLLSALVEDTQFKSNQQSLRIEEIPKENL
jgi:hypothetical protein